MQLRRLLIGATLALALFIPASARAQNPHNQTTLNIPVNQVLTDATTGAQTGNFLGQLAVHSFTNQNGSLAAVGTLTGQITNTAGTVLGTIAVPVTVPVAAATGTCTILHLTLGPLDLNVLGLLVHLNQVVLDISAQPGPGNLLGNLLCDVANLLNGGGAINQLVNSLNGLLAAL